MHVALLYYAIPVRAIYFTKSNGEAELLERIRFPIPAFHVYCHTASYQVTPKGNNMFACLCSPRRCVDWGLSDGEVVKRLWAYLRRFSKITKDMLPAHRVDVMSHALLHYAFKSKEKLGSIHATACWHACIV